MRRIWIIMITALCLALTLAAFSAGCVFHPVVGSGRTVSQNYNFTDFTSINANWSFNIQVNQSSTYAVSVSVDDNLQSYLKVTQDGGTLDIGMKSGYTYLSSHLSAVVSMPRLTGITISGACKANAAGFNLADDFTLNVSGASQANFTSMTVNKLTLNISGASRASGASTITLSGQALDADIESSGASRVDLTNFVVRDAYASVSGASNATVNASGTLSGDVSGASHLYYTGAPTLGDINTSGASSVSKK
jgi:hypothetical protein